MATRLRYRDISGTVYDIADAARRRHAARRMPLIRYESFYAVACQVYDCVTPTPMSHCCRCLIYAVRIST